jgi:phosphoribosylformylglycinamidine synthase
MIGICNGFQIMVKAGILPGPLTAEEENDHKSPIKTTLMNNDSGKFEDRWIHLRVDGKSPWLNGLKEIVFLPVAHGEGKFVAEDQKVLDRLKQNSQVAFRYCDEKGMAAEYPENPNGSVDHVAGITDKTGRILGLMPHPERHFLFTQHPFWTRLSKKERFGDGAKIFENGVKYVEENLLS